MQIKQNIVIGTKITTTNENGQSAKDIGQLWEKFITEKIADKIPNRIDDEILSVYCNYQGDYTQPFDNIIGCRVAHLENIPDGMTGQVIETGEYRKFIARGDVTQGAVAETWQTIWKTNIPRAYKTDFEVYGKKAKNPHDAEIPIFIGVNE